MRMARYRLERISTFPFFRIWKTFGVEGKGTSISIETMTLFFQNNSISNCKEGDVFAFAKYLNSKNVKQPTVELWNEFKSQITHKNKNK